MKQINFTNNISLADEITKHKLSLRKTTLNNELLNKRVIHMKKQTHSIIVNESLLININTLELPLHIHNESFTSIASAIGYINSLLQSKNINEIKYAIVFIKNNITERYLFELIRSKIMYTLLQCMCKYKHDIQIVYEILSCLYTLMFHYNDNYFLDEIISEKTMNVLAYIMKYNNTHITSLLLVLLKNIYNNEYISPSQRNTFISSDLFQQDILTYITAFINKHEHNEHICSNEEELLITNVIALYSTIIVYNAQHKIKINKDISFQLMQMLITCTKYSDNDNDNDYERIYLILSALKECNSNNIIERIVPLIVKSVLFMNILNGVYNNIPKIKYLISYVLCYVYHYLNVLNDIDNDILDNIIRYELRYITEINEDELISELYWRVSLLINKREWIIHRVIHSNKFMNEIVKCVIYETKLKIVKTCFKCVKAMIKYANDSDVKLLLIEMNLFDKIISSNIFDKVSELDLACYVLSTVYYSFKRWERLNDNENKRNLFLNKFIMHGGIDLIEKHSQTNYLKLLKVLNKLITEYNLMNAHEMEIDEVCSEYNVIKI